MKKVSKLDEYLFDLNGYLIIKNALSKKELKDNDFLGFTIDNNLLCKAKEDAIVLHCLPAYRSKEITDEVIESKKSRIFNQAENRMHVQQALLASIFSK